jgi:hypothetical protein
MASTRHPCGQALLTVAVLTLLACSDVPDPDEFRVGATRDQVLAIFGAPSRQQTFIKKDEHIFGPIEDFWMRVPFNSAVEIWTYRAKGGSIELYFVDESEQVLAMGFAPDGVVY